MEFDLVHFGAADLQNVFNDFNEKAQARIMRRALKEGAEIVKDNAVDNVLNMRVTGRHSTPLAFAMMEEKIRVKKGSSRHQGSFTAYVSLPSRDRLGISKKTKFYYPAHIELGTANRPAIPFLRNASEGSKGTVFNKVKNELKAGIARETKRLSSRKRRGFLYDI